MTGPRATTVNMIRTINTYIWHVFLFGASGGISTILPAKSDSDVMFCLQSYQELVIDKSLVY